MLPELSILYALPQVAPGVVDWRESWPARHPEESPEQLAARMVGHTTRTASFGGAVIGSSFYVGMIPAAAMIYGQQVISVLRIAAVFGLDPADPLRAAEFLVIHGRHPTVTEAAAALTQAAKRNERPPSPRRLARLGASIRELLETIGVQLNRLRSPMEILVTALEVIAYLIPIISIPIWVAANMRASRRVSRSALNFYLHNPLEAEDLDSLNRPPLAARHRRGLLISLLATGTLLLVGLGLVIGPRGWAAHHLPFGGLLLAEIALVWTGIRLLLMTRSARRQPADESDSHAGK